MGFVHFGRVCGHKRNRVAQPDATFGEGRSEPPTAGVRLRPGEATRAVDDGCPLRIDIGAPLDEHEWGEWRIVSRVSVEAGLVRVSHGAPPRTQQLYGELYPRRRSEERRVGK